MKIEVMICDNPYVCLNYHTHIKTTKVIYRKDNKYKKVVDSIESIKVHRKSKLFK